MKTVKCPLCYRIREVENSVILSICKSCLVEMLEFDIKNHKFKHIEEIKK